MALDNGLLKTLLLISVFFKGTSSRSNSNISSVKGIRRLIAWPTLVSSLTLNKFGQEIFLSISFKLLRMTAPFLANLLWWWVSVPYVNKLNKKNPTLNKGGGHDYLIMMKRRSTEPSTWDESYFTRADLVLRCALSHHNHNSALATWSRGRVQIGNTSFTISTNAIASVTGLPASGAVYFKRSLQAELQDFIDKGEKPTKYLSGYVSGIPAPPLGQGRRSNYEIFHHRWAIQSLEHSLNLAREGEGPFLHQGLLYLLFKCIASPAEIAHFPSKSGRSRRTPTSSPLPSPASRPTSSQHRRLQVSSDSDSEVAIVGSSFAGFAPPVSPVSPPHSPGQTCLDLPDVDVVVTASSPVSSSELRLSDALLGLAKLYPDSPESGPVDMDEEPNEEGLNLQSGTENFIMVDSGIIPQDIQMEAPSKVEDTVTGNIVGDDDGTAADTSNQPEDRQVELVSSILAKLQRSFSFLKAWEIFTDNTRAAITKDFSELIALCDQLAEESGSIHAKHTVKELRKLL
ncbi:hypothetical protein KI387_029023 [Taxus chinensis]|uniref:Uncharacterized protein n=1 Tax=Taxus chinensis TaxID=29808 RepID=A0AA38FDL7_TAXCH|nr:hypothetical protein KI387_029023 [Taxus chinensis]